jgi:hypothetical protein
MTTTAQPAFDFGQAEAATARPSAARELVTRAEVMRRQQERQGCGEPDAPDWTTFAINPESRYAQDDQEPDALAQICATELKGYLFSARLLRVALKAGRNPLYKGARTFTEKQTRELAEDARQAEDFAGWMREQCADAFGEEAAERLYEYARACVEQAVPDEVPEDSTREPPQTALTF